MRLSITRGNENCLILKYKDTGKLIMSKEHYQNWTKKEFIAENEHLKNTKSMV